MSKTIKQLADELGVSKQTIRYHLKSLPVKFTGKDNKNRITVNARSWHKAS
ncbi:helix-turn-helix domain-containing protein (plasmid) [Lactobacillus sp. ESL0731]|uniref:helix-turn-helix domain-containing protein n=1 Tax=Lactobacillus sp. ESL0731 TaxID=2983221 RepID=UPI0023F85E9D|nr:helix-turn-helix domain-containing protein [Lactobacillus sp. ESL0731]WEV63206.1 helix-turn-helix domain-containing protein [Lactobacillus sp. ESL0731]